MTREQKLEAYGMRLDGCTYQEIADKFGVTRQYIQQSIPSEPNNPRRSKPLLLSKKCIYKGLSKFIEENRISSSTIADIIQVCRVSAYQRIVGERNFNISDVYKLLDYTGMTFEECFELKKSEVKENE